MQVNARLLAKKPTELEEGEWTAAAAGKLEPNMTRRSSLRAIPQNSAKRCKVDVYGHSTVIRSCS